MRIHILVPAIVLVSLSVTSFAQQSRTRRSIDVLSDTELSDYVWALDKLRARSTADPDDPKGYDFQAGLHNDGSIGPCEHGNDRFFAWHRAHLYYFENLLRESDPPRTANVTIPYWDWIHPQEGTRKFPVAFSKPGLTATVERSAEDDPLPEDTLQIVTQISDWSEFGGFPVNSPNGNYGAFELGPHNYMHPTYIGGLMASPQSAAQDPIYFSFHCFIDLLWAEWQRRNNSPPPTSPTANLRGFQNQPRKKVSEFQSLAELGYDYEYTAALKQAFGMPTPAPQPQLIEAQRLKALSDEPVADQLKKQGRLSFSLPKKVEPAKRVLMRVRDLKVPVTGSYMIRAFLHPKGITVEAGNPDFRKKYGTGYIVLWQGHVADKAKGEHAHHPSTCSAKFDVTKVLAQLREAGAAENLVLSLHIVPAAPGSAGKPLGDKLIKEVDFKDLQLERYK